MFSRTGRRAAAALLAAALPLVLPAGPARAQCRGGRTQSYARRYVTPPTYPVYPFQQQQYTQLLALQQQQQYAMLLAMQQLNAQPAVLQARQPPANGGVAQLRPAQVQAPVPMPVPEQKDAVPPAAPEEAAGRQLKFTRDLLADADRAAWHGDTDRAAKMRQRAGERLRELVSKYPATHAADDARDLLDTLDL
jgi:hypothetical protein